MTPDAPANIEAERTGYLVLDKDGPTADTEAWVKRCVNLGVPTIIVQRHGASWKVFVITYGLPQAENVRTIVRDAFALARKRHRPARIKEGQGLKIDGLPHALAIEVATDLVEKTGPESYLARVAKTWGPERPAA